MVNVKTSGQVFLAGLLMVAVSGASGVVKPPHGDAEAALSAKRVGLDYLSLYQAAWNHPQALPAFLAIEAGRFMDGAAGDDYCDGLLALLEKHGDQPFADAVRNFAPPVRRQILTDLHFASNPKGEIATPEFQAKYPLTEALAGDTPRTYVVQKGDTLEGLAKRLSPQGYRDVMRQIVTLNNLASPDVLKIGTTLKVP